MSYRKGRRSFRGRGRGRRRGGKTKVKRFYTMSRGGVRL